MGGNAMIYIAHPYGGTCINKLSVERIIRKLVQSNTATYISPIHAFGFMYNDVSYDQGMLFCLELLSKCDSAIFCPGWERSEGCRREMEWCKQYGKLFIILDTGGQIL